MASSSSSASPRPQWMLWAAAVVVTAAMVLLIVLLIVLRQQHGAIQTAAEAERRRLTEQLQQNDVQWRERVNARSAALDNTVGHLVTVRLPATLNESAEPSHGPETLATDREATALCDRILTAVDDGAGVLRERLAEREESLRLAVVALARRVQTSAHRIQEEAVRMADRHPENPDVLRVSMRVDHAAAQQARHAQSLAVLCGEWPGQQWPQPVALVDVVRAASGRIVPYERVEVAGDPDVAAAAQVAEPLIHLVAELLANATQSSPPQTQVLVSIRSVQRGAVLEIDDGGVGMDEHRLEQAREVASGRRPVGLGELGEIPQMGLPVVGQYVQRFGFRVDMSESVYGGVRVVVLVPGEVVDTVEPAGAAPARAGTPQVDPVPAPQAPIAPAGEADSVSAEGLPQRRSRRGETPASTPTSVPTSAQPTPPTTPEEAGDWMGAFLHGASRTTDAGAAASDDDDPGTHE